MTRIVRGPLVVVLLAILAACGAGSDERSPGTIAAALYAAAAETCSDVPACVPQCDGRTCGLDPVCGMPCGSACSDGSYCTDAGQCALLSSMPDDLPPPLPQQPTTQGVGSTPGTFQVSASGQAVYSVPLDVPIGVNGLTPELGLRYESMPRYGGFGMVGWGWSLTGLSSIDRCGMVEAQSPDGFARPIRDDASDRFCLDGQMLVAVSGEYGQDGTEYRTEVESFTRVISKGTSGPHSPGSFVAYAKNGKILYYGTRTDAFQGYRGVTRHWALSEVRDRSNNMMQIRYRNECNGDSSSCRILQPDEIVCGIHEEGRASDRKIKFTYGSGKDTRRYFSAGQEQYSDQPLSSIEQWVGGNKVRWCVFRPDLGTRSGGTWAPVPT